GVDGGGGLVLGERLVGPPEALQGRAALGSCERETRVAAHRFVSPGQRRRSLAFPYFHRAQVELDVGVARAQAVRLHQEAARTLQVAASESGMARVEPRARGQRRLLGRVGPEPEVVAPT